MNSKQPFTHFSKRRPSNFATKDAGMNIAAIFSGGGSQSVLVLEAFKLSRGNFRPYKETLSHNVERLFYAEGRITWSADERGV